MQRAHCQRVAIPRLPRGCPIYGNAVHCREREKVGLELRPRFEAALMGTSITRSYIFCVQTVGKQITAIEASVIQSPRFKPEEVGVFTGEKAGEKSWLQSTVANTTRGPLRQNYVGPPPAHRVELSPDRPDQIPFKSQWISYCWQKDRGTAAPKCPQTTPEFYAAARLSGFTMPTSQLTHCRDKIGKNI
jgi:hypothetical protein